MKNLHVTSDPQTCHIRHALDVLGPKWTLLIVAYLKETRRFGELKRMIPGISEKVLIQRLRSLEAHGFVSRKEFSVIPPKVEYSLTKNGVRTLDIIPILKEVTKGIKIGEAPVKNYV